MTPFLHFRSWLTAGPSAERGLTAAAAALVLALVVWASIPADSPGGDGDVLASEEAFGTEDSVVPAQEPAADGAIAPGSVEGPVAGPAAPGRDGAADPGPGAPSGAAPEEGSAPTGGDAGAGSGPAPGASSGARAPAAGPAAPVRAANACGPLTATDQGVTAKTITVGVVVVDLGSAGGVIDLPSKADLMKAYNAVFDAINANGGVRCRKVVPKYYTDSVADTSQEHAECLRMQEDKIFIAFNNMFNTTEQTCIAKGKIPNVWYTTPHTPDVRKFAPYILSWHAHYDQLIRHYVRAAKGQGWFTGIKKLGILQGSCYPDENVALRKELRAIGMDPGKAQVFDYGCNAGGTATPDQNQAAVLQFKREGVTHVMNVAYANDGSFSNAADQQAYDPAFVHMEDASATAIETGTQKPGRSYDKALLISAIETGARNTAGYKHNKATQECTRILQGAGLPAPYAKPSGLYFGVACVNAQMFKAMAEKAPELERDQMALGLSRVGALELSFPSGPGNFTDATLPTGGQLWRPAAWATACQCWKVTDARYRPGY